jgi:C4-dicarboxylate transporter DctM subunit
MPVRNINFPQYFLPLRCIRISTWIELVTSWRTTNNFNYSCGGCRPVGGATPTEAAGVAVVYSIFVTIVIYRELSIARLWKILVDAAFLISRILLIVCEQYSWR